MGNLIKLLVVSCLAIVVFRVTTVTAYNGGESQIIGPHNLFQPKSAEEFLHRVWQQWIPVKGQKWKQVEVAFTAHSDGHLTNLRIDETSKYEAVDNMALDAVRKAAPLNVIANKGRWAVDVEILFVKADVSEPEYPEKIPNEQVLVMDSKPDIELGPYITALEPQLSHNWRPPAWNKHNFPTGGASFTSLDGDGEGVNFSQRLNEQRTVISFRVNRSGQFFEIKVDQSCGDAACCTALSAVQQAASGPALPNGAPESIDLEWCFSEADKLYLHILVP